MGLFIREAQQSNFYSEFIRENEQISSTPNLPFLPGLGWFKSFLSTRVEAKVWAAEDPGTSHR